MLSVWVYVALDYESAIDIWAQKLNECDGGVTAEKKSYSFYCLFLKSCSFNPAFDSVGLYKDGIGPL